MAARRRAREYIRSSDFVQWTQSVDALAYYKDQGRLDKVTLEKIDELIERGNKLQREMRGLRHDKWSYTMLLLKRMRREVAPES